MVNGHTEPGRRQDVVRRRLADGREDLLVREEPLAISVAGREVLTMRTPGDDEHLTLGFLLSEGVISGVDDVVAQTLHPGDPAALRPDLLVVELAPGTLRAEVAGRLTRVHEVRSSCGVCGLADPDQMLEELPPLLPGTPRLAISDIDLLRARFESLQVAFRDTGACHGAAVFGPGGEIWGHGEDVGRHNALDKAIGAAARGGHDLAHACVFLSGRAGYDLVVKCLRLRIGAILSVSAPSGLSFDLATAAGATLVGFVRPGRHQVYVDGGRLH